MASRHEDDPRREQPTITKIMRQHSCTHHDKRPAHSTRSPPGWLATRQSAERSLAQEKNAIPSATLDPESTAASELTHANSIMASHNQDGTHFQDQVHHPTSRITDCEKASSVKLQGAFYGTNLGFGVGQDF